MSPVPAASKISLWSWKAAVPTCGAAGHLAKLCPGRNPALQPQPTEQTRAEETTMASGLTWCGGGGKTAIPSPQQYILEKFTTKQQQQPRHQQKHPKKQQQQPKQRQQQPKPQRQPYQQRQQRPQQQASRKLQQQKQLEQHTQQQQ